ncbi:MAG: hypothetical protein WBL52_01200 [Bacillota bacterium]|nr:hypothetical protein [Candidatus Fermentithermobacillaceae bacterium]HOA71001.1 hypothetical protein [Bacillota bacterium]HOP70387.1 hypothetical protein [Bacillota bacterium]HPT36347.1 hypothetical protein [Bacillota bacterium]HPZ85452.1 hypothetical protein [Bacillota bacterium]
MEKYLRSLLASLDGVEQTVSNGSLSRLAQVCLTSEGAGDPAWVREKAGLLALLNLMGILEVFYAAGELQEVSAPRRTGLDEAGLDAGRPDTTGDDRPATQAAPSDTGPETSAGSSGSPKDSPVAEAIAQPAATQGSIQTQAQPAGLPGTQGGAAKPDALAPLLSALPLLLGSKQGGIDPNLISAILKLIPSLTRSKPASAPEASGDAAAVSKEEPTASSQGSFGLDPKLIVSLVNFLAGLEKSRSKPASTPVGPPPPEAPGKHGQEVQISLSPDGESVIAKPVSKQPSQCIKTPVQPPAQRHKPGVGIRRGWLKQRRLEPDEIQDGTRRVLARHR